MVCLLCSTSASAYDLEVDGIYYEIVSISDLTCKVVSGDKKYEGDIVIPKTVNYNNKTLAITTIGFTAFRNSDLTSITIPNTISSIENNAFWDCDKLERIVIEDGKTILTLGWIAYNDGVWALFRDCPIKSLYLGRNITCTNQKGYQHDISPFYNIETLNELIIGDSVTEITSNLFKGCTGLTNVEFSKSITSIGYNAFKGCTGLTNIKILYPISELKGSAFEGCSGLTDVTIGSSITKINEKTFYNCTNLKNVTHYNSITSIGESAFENCTNLTNFVIPNTVTKIDSYAFRNCTGLTQIIIPNSVTELNNYAFYGCSGLTDLSIGNSITKIYRNTFQNCTNFISITLGKAITNMADISEGIDFFNNCKNLKNLYLLNTTPPTLYSGSCFTTNQYMTLNVFVPEKALEAYQSADGWKDFWNLQGFNPSGIENIKTETEKAVYYDLHGTRLNTPKRGMNIINGKKVIMK